MPGDVYYASILYVGLLAYLDFVDIPSYHGAIPYGGGLANLNITNNDSTRCDENCWMDFGFDLTKW